MAASSSVGLRRHIVCNSRLRFNTCLTIVQIGIYFMIEMRTSLLRSSWCGLAVIAALTMISTASSPVRAATSYNANSALGLNLAGVSYWTSEMPFLDNFKTCSGFSTHTSSGAATNEEQYLNLDADGWPISLTAVNEPTAQQFTQLSTLILRNMPNTPNGTYPAGQYIVRYQGQGTITYAFDAVKLANQSTPGRDVINVAKPTSGGIWITITSTDPNHTGNYLKNIQVVKAEQESALIAGQVFNPYFLNLVRNFRVLRFMDWFNTNGSTLSSWTSRPQQSYMTWGTAGGVPYEVAVQLANAISADAWINIPVMADNNYITQFATLVHSQLGGTQKVYVELSNEVWNPGFPQWAYANAQGQATWPNAGSGADYGNNWYGMRVAQTCDTWKSIWGSDASRVVCVMGSQGSVPWIATERLACSLWTGPGNAPCANHGIGAVAIAPYFGYSVPSAWTSQPDGGLTLFFASLYTQNDPSIPAGGGMAHIISQMAANPPAIAQYHLPLIAYEGGQGFVSFPHGMNANNTPNAMTNLFVAANNDPRMQAAYAQYLEGWKKIGGQLFMQFNDISPYNQYGEWGALQSIMQTTSPLTSAPPKWQALQGFISGNACWWAGCVGSIATTPMAPSSLRAAQ
jgi:hypothetical protein